MLTKSILKSLWKQVYFILEVLSTFLLKDFVFVVLPIIVLIFYRHYFNSGSIKALIGSADFSFIVVILLSISLSNFIEFKVTHQNDKSHKLFDGTRLITIILILAVLVLVFALFEEQPDLYSFNPKIYKFNIYFFMLGTGTLLLTAFRIKCDEKDSENFDKPKKLSNVLDYLNKSIYTAVKELDYSFFVLKSFTIKQENEKNYNNNRIQTLHLEKKIYELEDLLEKVKKEFSARKQDMEQNSSLQA